MPLSLQKRANQGIIFDGLLCILDKISKLFIDTRALSEIRKMEEVCLCADLPRFIYWVVRGAVLLQKLDKVK